VLNFGGRGGFLLQKNMHNKEGEMREGERRDVYQVIS
jgi:hypothetical protein